MDIHLLIWNLLCNTLSPELRLADFLKIKPILTGDFLIRKPFLLGCNYSGLGPAAGAPVIP